MADCKTCKHKGTNTHYCDECSSDYDMYERKIVTNAMRIRAMSDEELAQHFSELLRTAQEYEYCVDAKEWLKWLQEEAED